MNKKRQKYIQISVRFVIRVLGIDTKVEYKCDPSNEEPTLIMPTHASMVDVMATYACTSSPVNYIFKRSLLFIPFFGMMGLKAGNIPIDRGNLQKAIKSLEKAATQIKEEKKTIAVSPEGTRRRKKSVGNIDQLLPFKKGPFHLAKNSKSSIIPIVWIGCKRLSNGYSFNEGKFNQVNLNLNRVGERILFRKNTC